MTISKTDHWNFAAKHLYIIHYNDVIMGPIASQITSLTIVFSTVDLDTDQRKHQSSASLAFVRGIHRRPVNSPHKWPVTRKMFPFDDVIMFYRFMVYKHARNRLTAKEYLSTKIRNLALSSLCFANTIHYAEIIMSNKSTHTESDMTSMITDA